MSEMIERVARALAKEEGYAYDPFPYDARARAAIEAMREFFDEKHDMTSEHWSTVEIINAALRKVDA